MKEAKPNTKQKGLTDKELIKKYESGKAEVGKVVRNMISHPNPKIEKPNKG